MNTFAINSLIFVAALAASSSVVAGSEATSASTQPSGSTVSNDAVVSQNNATYNSPTPVSPAESASINQQVAQQGGSSSPGKSQAYVSDGEKVYLMTTEGGETSFTEAKPGDSISDGDSN